MRIPVLILTVFLASCAMPDIKTVAERTDYKQTSLHKDVQAFIAELRKHTSRMQVESMGKSGLGQDMPVLIFGTDGKPVILIIANIHAGEVEGKEVALMLARDLTIGPHRDLLKKLKILIIPNYNPDGNDAISKNNRKYNTEKMTGQNGPEGGVGTRYTGKGINLNRDYMKMEAIESVNLSRLYGKWRPHITMDLHTTNGSLHRYSLTYDTAHNRRSGHPAPIEYVFDALLPDVTRKVKESAGFDMWFYGNFKDRKDPEKGWATYSPLPRYGSHYRGLVGRMDILSEAYSYVPFRERAEVTYAFVLETMRHLAANGDRIVNIIDEAERDTIRRGENPDPNDLVGINYGVARRTQRGLSFSYPADPLIPEVTILSYDRESLKNHSLRGAEPKDYQMVFYADFVPKKSVARPYAYVLAVPEPALAKLREHNIRLERLTADVEVDVEAYKVTNIEKTFSPDVGDYRRFESVFSVELSRGKRNLSSGSVIVRTAQPLANLAIYLLEPESDDGLVRWNFFDGVVEKGKEYPVLRIPAKTDLPSEELK